MACGAVTGRGRVEDCSFPGKIGLTVWRRQRNPIRPHPKKGSRVDPAGPRGWRTGGLGVSNLEVNSSYNYITYTRPRPPLAPSSSLHLPWSIASHQSRTWSGHCKISFERAFSPRRQAVPITRLGIERPRSEERLFYCWRLLQLSAPPWLPRQIPTLSQSSQTEPCHRHQQPTETPPWTRLVQQHRASALTKSHSMTVKYACGVLKRRREYVRPTSFSYRSEPLERRSPRISLSPVSAHSLWWMTIQ